MRTNAISIANYFIDKANENREGRHPFTLLRLVKYVYIAYGFGMAILDKKIIDERFDKVEAWKYGPVIPSVYHSFKHNGKDPITTKSIVLVQEEEDGTPDFITPEIDRNNTALVKLLDFVWDRYEDYSISELIDILHDDGTPWKYCYKEGENVSIPDEMTKIYYDSIVENAIQSWKKKR